MGSQNRYANCVWTADKVSNYQAAYIAKVRITVRAGDVNIVREGSGTGEATAPTPGQAHELALKGAETDATKRALATFGNPFGLALYDREQTGVRKARAPVSLADKSRALGCCGLPPAPFQVMKARPNLSKRFDRR